MKLLIILFVLLSNRLMLCYLFSIKSYGSRYKPLFTSTHPIISNNPISDDINKQHLPTSTVSDITISDIVVSKFKQLHDDLKSRQTETKLKEALEYIRIQKLQNRIQEPKDVMNCVNILKIAKRMPEAIEFLDYMNQNHIEIDTRIYNNLLDGCEKLDEHDLFDSLFQRMIRSNIPRDTISYGSLLHSLSKRGYYKETLQVFQSMGNYDHVYPDAMCYSAAIIACIKNNQYNHAIKILHDMENRKECKDVRVYNSAIKACATAISVHNGSFLISSMNSTMNSNLSSTTGSSYSMQVLDIAEYALQVFHMLLNRSDILPDSYTFGSILTVLDSNNLCDKILDIVITYLPKYPSSKHIIPYNIAIKALLRHGYLDKAMVVYNSMKSYHIIPNQFTVTDLITTFVRYQNYSEALNIFNDILLLQIPRNSAIYGSIITAAEKLGQYKLVLSLLNAMKKENIHPNTGMYNSAIAVCSKYTTNGTFEICKALLKEMIDLKIMRSVTTYNLMIGACKKTGNWRFAVKYLNDISKDKNEGCIIGSYASSNNSSVVTSTLERYTNDSNLIVSEYSHGLTPTTASYSATISVCVESKQWGIALELLDEMEELGIQRNIVTYNSVIQALDAAEESIRAELVYQSALRSGIYNHMVNSTISSNTLLPSSPSMTFNPSRGVEYENNKVILSRSNKFIISNHSHDAKSRIYSSPDVVMDLHKFPTAVAKAAVMHVLGEICSRATPPEDNQTRSMTESVDNLLSNVGSLEIITGRGNHIHTSGRRGVLRSDIQHFLTNIGLEYDKNVDNPGRISISKYSIEKWLLEQIEDDRLRKKNKSTHGNLFLRVAYAKNLKDMPGDVRATCPFSSTVMPTSTAPQFNQ